MKNIKNKTYPIQQSPLFKIGSKKKLCELLRVEFSTLEDLKSDKYYRIFYKENTKKKRQIEEPVGIRRFVHERLQKLMMKIEKPNYLFSARKGVSSIDNAKFHKDRNYFLVVDIENFYKSAKKEYIFRFFHYQMEIPEDISGLLADIICFNNHIPTGSPVSQTIAYFAYSRTFNNLYDLSRSKNVDFSLYVDDMTFSSNEAVPPNFHLSINYLLKRVELKLKTKKTKYLSKNKHKLVTGVIISPKNELKTPNKHLKKIKDHKDFVGKIDLIDSRNIGSLIGKIRYARQIEPNSHEHLYNALRTKEKQFNQQ